MADKHSKDSEISIVLPYGVIRIPADREGRRLANELKQLLQEGGNPVED